MAQRKTKGWNYTGAAGGVRSVDKRPSLPGGPQRGATIRTLFFNTLRSLVIWFFGGRTIRRVTLTEIMVWLAATVVAGALLLLLAKQTWLLAMLIFLAILGFAWRELSVQK